MAAAREGLGQVVSWWVCTFAALVFLVIRLAVRWNRFDQLYLDDYLILLAFGCLVGDLGIQQHMWNLGVADLGATTRPEFIGIMQMIIPGSTLYVSSLWAVKLSLVIFYKRLAAKTSSTLHKIYNCTVVGLFITWVGIVFFIVFQCYPVERKWTSNPAEACSATNSTANYWVMIMLNIFSDLFIMALPVSMVLRMKLPMRQRLGIVGVFSLGFCVVIASIVRAYYSHIQEVMLTSTVSMIETTIAIIATCLPTLRTLIYTVRTRSGTGSMPISNGRHYELSGSNGVTATKIAAASKNKSRVSTYSIAAATKNKSRASAYLHPGTNNWPYPGDRGQTKTGQTVNDSDESLFRPVGTATDNSVASTNTVDIDPRTLGVLPDVESDRIRGNREIVCEDAARKKSNEAKGGGIMVTTDFRIRSESMILKHPIL